MRYLSLFSGIEAATVAWSQLGWEAVAFAQYDPTHAYKSGPDFPSAVLAHHYPTVPNLGDVTRITDEQIKHLGRIDIIVGGFPCQDLSVAGKRKGLRNDDGTLTRSGLFFDAIRLVRVARDHCGCRFLLLENVPGLFSSNGGADFAALLGEMVGSEFTVPKGKWQNAGMAVGPDGAVEWCVLDAQYFGLAQRRRRVFALADFGDWANRQPVLLEPKSLHGDPPPRRETREDITHGVAPSLTGSGRGVSRTGESRGQDPVVAATLEATAGRSRGAGTPIGMLAVQETVGTVDSAGDKGGTLQDAVSGRLLPVQAFGGNNTSGAIEVATALKANAVGSGYRYDFDSETFIAQPAYCQDVADPITAHESKTWTHEGSNNFRTRNITAVTAFDTTQITHPENRSNPQPGAPCHTLPTDGHPPAIAFQPRFARNGRGAPDEVASPLTAEAGTTGKGDSAQCIATPAAVRRLTPVECERLQGFRDGYTAIPWRGKPADACPDGPRYKALGNSFAVPCVLWIGRRIDQAVAQ